MADEVVEPVEASNAGTKTPASKMRSPNYPVTDVLDAIERAKKVYSAIRFGSGAQDIVAAGMGYKGLNGASRTMISALKKFGLIDEVKDGLRLSEDAKALVMLSSSDVQYIESAKRCALKPAIFAEMFKQYGSSLPSDQPLRYILVKKGFTEEAANEVIRNYKKTIEFVVRLSPGGLDLPEQKTDSKDENIGEGIFTEAEESAPMSQTISRSNSGSIGLRQGSPEKKITETLYESVAELHLTLPGGCKAHVNFEGNVTKEAVERLRVYLEFFAEDQPSMKSASFPKSKEAELAPDDDSDANID